MTDPNIEDPTLEEDLADESDNDDDLPEPADPATVPDPEGEQVQ